MKLGFIGARNMAKAMIGGILKNNIFKPEEVIASDLYDRGSDRQKKVLEFMLLQTIKRLQEQQKCSFCL